MKLKHWLIILPGMIICSTIFAQSPPTNSDKILITACNTKKIQACMQNCVKQINPHTGTTQTATPLNQCVNTCNTQGCQVAQKK